MTTATDRIGILATSLRVLANAAPRSPWRVHQSSGYGYPSVANADGPLLSTGNARKRTRTEQAALARYVAAVSPETVLNLLDIVETLAAERDALVAGIDRMMEAFEVPR